MKGETYDEFVDKFKAKHTTDDCYTPPAVYECVANYVSSRYGVDRSEFCRPFYPGGDFEHYDYTGKTVVDNPPFSIFTKIVNFYLDHDVPFFLFAPTLTYFNCHDLRVNHIVTNAGVIYENGANINTSFLTNIQTDGVVIQTDPEFRKALMECKEDKRKPKFVKPPNVYSIAEINRVKDKRCKIYANQVEKYIRQIDGRSIYGGGYLLKEGEQIVIEDE